MFISWVLGDAEMFSTPDDITPVNMDSEHAIVRPHKIERCKNALSIEHN
jgi:hypothetical protein